MPRPPVAAALAAFLLSAPIGAWSAPRSDEPSPSAPIAVAVKTEYEDKSVLGGLIAVGRSSSDAAHLVDDLEEELGHASWLRLVTDGPEVQVRIAERLREERSRSRDKEGNEKIDWRYSGSGDVQVGGGRLVSIRASIDFTEDDRHSLDDDAQYRALTAGMAQRVKWAIEDELDTLRPGRPQAGFTHARKFKLMLKGDGLEVKTVEAGSPAEKAGLRVKDRIRRIDSEKGTDEMDLATRRWWLQGAGTQVELEVERDKKRQTLALTLQPRGEWSRSGDPEK